MKIVSLFAIAGAIVVAAPAVAGPIFVGSWQVDQGPEWPGSIAYSGTAAAAFLYGGVASDYMISTVDDQIDDIDHLAWVSTFAGACGGADPCGTKVDENYVHSTAGLYADYGDTSAYVNDWAYGSQYTNYAFRISSGAVPEPASWAMMVAGFGLAGAAMRRRKANVAFA